MSLIPYVPDTLGPEVELLTLSQIAAGIGLSVSKVTQQLRDGDFLAVRRDGELQVPAAFFAPAPDGRRGIVVVPTLTSLISVLRDGGFKEPEIMEWLFRVDPSLTIPAGQPGYRAEGLAPAFALTTHAAREVMRRAQALAM